MKSTDTRAVLASALKVEMPDRDEHVTLRRIEWQIAASDAEFATVLRDGQRRLPKARSRTRRPVLIVLLVLLTVGLLVLRLPASAVDVALLTAGAWWMRRCGISQEP
jgi:Protein of unknown function (DUF3040)